MTGFNSKRAMARDKLEGHNMSGIKDLAYDIEALYIEGCHPTKIAQILGCPLSMVYDWLEGESLGVAEEPQNEIYSPYHGA